MRKTALGICLCWLLAASLAFAAEIPRPAPAVSYPTTTGSTIDLAKYKGKVVALEFLQTTCPHCQKTSGIMQRLYQEYGPRGFQPIGVATNDEAARLVPEFIKNFGLSFPVGYTTRDKAAEFVQYPVMRILYVPHLVFIDRQGIIRAEHEGEMDEKELRTQIESMLGDKKGASPASSTPKKKSETPKSGS